MGVFQAPSGEAQQQEGRKHHDMLDAEYDIESLYFLGYIL
jgi:hypothetical protein